MPSQPSSSVKPNVSLVVSDRTRLPLATACIMQMLAMQMRSSTRRHARARARAIV